MSRPHSEDLRVALSDSFTIEYSADLYYDGGRRFEGLQILNPSFGWDGSADIEAAGSCTIMWTDDQGTSLSPVDPQDWLAPFGAELVIFVTISADAFEERVQLGVYQITSVPDASDDSIIWDNRRITVGSKIDVELSDRMIAVKRDQFVSPTSPAQLDSTYDELKRLVGYPLTKTVVDGPINRALVYDTDRVKACQTLASGIGGVPFIEWNGNLSVRPDATPGVVAALMVGETGTVVEVGSVLDSARVFNGVVIVGETDGQSAILAQKWIETGPLRATAADGVRTPYHRVPKVIRDQLITTQQQAEDAIDGLLAQYSQPRAAQLNVRCVFDPTLQLGDATTVNDGIAVWTIRLVKVNHPGGQTMTVLGDVLARMVLGAGEEVPVLAGYGEGGYGEGGYGL